MPTHNPIYAYVHISAKTTNILEALINEFKKHFYISTILTQENGTILEIVREPKDKYSDKRFISLDKFKKEKLNSLPLLQYVITEEVNELSVVKALVAKENSWLVCQN